MSNWATDQSSAGKKSFSSIYDQPDPSAYFSTLKPLRYLAPHHGQPIFRAAARALGRMRRKRVEMLDLCTGYGINGALLNHRVSMDDLYRHYKSADAHPAPPGERIQKDRAYFRKHRLQEPFARVTGIDVAGNALAYARDVGVLDDTLQINLEAAPLVTGHIPRIARADMITVTGGFSYIGARSMMRLLSLFPDDRMPWILAFPLRHTDFSECEAVFARFGLQVEQWDRWAFQHRNFANDGERAAVLDAYDADDDPIDQPLSDRHFQATLYVARPEADVARCALSELVFAKGDGGQLQPAAGQERPHAGSQSTPADGRP